MKVFVLTFFIIILTNLKSVDSYLRIRGIRCSSSLKSVKDPHCVIKSSKKDVLLSFSFVLLRKILDGKLHFKLDFGSTPPRSLFDFEELSICQILKGAKSSPIPFIQHVIDYLKKFQSNLFDACSEQNLKIEMNNFTYKEFTITDKFPVGLYYNHFKFFDQNDENIFTLNLNCSNIRKKN